MEIDTEELTKTCAEFTGKEFLRPHAYDKLTDITHDVHDVSDSNYPT